MHRVVLFLVVLMLAAQSVLAQGSHTITVIGDDGKAVVIDMGPETAAPEAPPEPEVIAAPPPVVEKAPPAPEPKKAKAVPKKKPPKKTEKKPPAPLKKAEPRVIPPGTEITEDMALSIAIDVAPPSGGYAVSRAVYEGKPVFAATFKTEEGLHDVLIDAATGAVVLNRPASVPSAPARPGHLPPALPRTGN